MKRALILVLLVACGKSGAERAKEEMAAKAAKEAADNPPPPPVEKKEAPAPAPVEKKEAAPPAPEPTTPAEIEKAFKQAMIDGKDKDVLKYCDMMKLDEKSNPQSLMGCTLAACRLKDADTAKKYSAGMVNTKDGKALLIQAKKVCATTQVAL